MRAVGRGANGMLPGYGKGEYGYGIRDGGYGMGDTGYGTRHPS